MYKRLNDMSAKELIAIIKTSDKVIDKLNAKIAKLERKLAKK